ncbi:RrF2 family transcriptional regulator [Seleniivibrio woodruffii]|uniref:RrF2 family transcriptional regulator n=1 Tax=Seleniivibrio woodruffii TaxID=1078050 RepID=UPI0039E6412B
MQFSVGVEYALHCLCYIGQERPVGVKELAAFQGISETYLSKMLTKLRKAGVVRSVSGVNGGYELTRPADEITFWDVVQAIEGSSPLFQCAEVRQNNIIVDKNNLPDAYCKEPCLIKVVMLEAEDRMRDYLRSKTIGWLMGEVRKKVDPKQLKDAEDYFKK